MDTRAKIAEAAECRAKLNQLRATGALVRVVSGYFDPVLASHAARLAEARQGAGALAVLVLDPPDPILPVRARAELVAALDVVSLALMPAAAETIEADLSLEDMDLDERARFVEHVRQRQS